MGRAAQTRLRRAGVAHPQARVTREAKKRPQSIEDLYRLGRYYVEEGAPETAARFLAAAERAITQLIAMPSMGARRSYRNSRLRGLRMWRISGFPEHLVFYRPTAAGIEIVRVLHAKRDLAGILRNELP